MLCLVWVDVREFANEVHRWAVALTDEKPLAGVAHCGTSFVVNQAV